MGRIIFIKLLGVCAFFTIIFSAPCFGGAFNFIGYGARNQGTANSTVSLPTDAFSQSCNPALMAFQPSKLFSLGVEGAVTSFKGINNIVVDTPSLGASSLVVGGVKTNTQDTFLYTIGYQTPLYTAEHPVHFGFTLVSPVQRIFEINTPDDFAPEYSMYSSDTQRLTPSLSLALALDDNFAIGAGANFYIVQATNTRQRLPALGNSSATIASDVKTGVAPELGISWRPNSKWTTGLSFRGKQDYQSQINIDASISLLGPSDLVLTNINSVAYDPDMILAGGSYSENQKDIFSAAIKYEAWGGYNGGAVHMTFLNYASFSQTLPSTPFHDIYTFHGGYQHLYSQSTLRFGYAYVPTPAPNPNAVQSSNILDSDKHEFYIGWGHKWEHFFLDGAIDLDLVGFVDYLVPYNVTKNDSQAIGYPGYTVGGTIFGYGLTFTREY